MTTQCTSTPEAVTGVLLAGDVLLNFAAAELRTVAGTPFVIERDGRLELSSESCQLTWQAALSGSLSSLLTADCNRLVVVSDPDCPRAADVVNQLQQQQLPYVHCVLAADCEADAFMDEADAEAVADRLRQLGYI